MKTQELINELLKIVPKIEKVEDKEVILKSCEKLAYLQNKINMPK